MDNIMTLDDLRREAEATVSEPVGDAQAKAESAEPEMSTQEMLYPAIRLVMDIIAPSWKITDTECTSLASAYAAVLDKYYPDGLGRFGVEINAIFITAIVFTPRMKTPRKPITVTAEPEPEESAKSATH